MRYPIWVQMLQLNALKEERVVYVCDVRACLPVHLVPPPRKASPIDTDPSGPSSGWKHTVPVTPHLPMMLSSRPFASLLAGWQRRGDITILRSSSFSKNSGSSSHRACLARNPKRLPRDNTSGSDPLDGLH